MTHIAFAEPVNDTCPWSGRLVQPDSLTLYRGHTVGFCNTGCRDKFEAATSRFDSEIAGLGAGPTLLEMAGAPAATARLDSAALVIVDAQEDYRSGALPLHAMATAVERATVLLARARAAGTPVIHVVHRGRAGGLLDLGGPGGAILPELQPEANEIVVEKALPNAFAGTVLQERLRALGRPSLILAGFMTHNCVGATARAAVDLGFRVTIAADATATRALMDPLGGPSIPAPDVQRTALAELADRFAAVVPTVELVDA